MMYPTKLIPETKDYLWGGSRLKEEFGIVSEEKILAEAWMLSCNPAGESIIAEGALKGIPLRQALFGKAEEALGKKNPVSSFFPILIKLIDAQKALSIQVHPSDGYAMEIEGGFGKTEMWYVLDAKEDAFLYYGFCAPVSKDEMKKRIENNTITEVLQKVPAKKGDTFFIQAGTIHAIGEGIVIAEVQQNSDTTYRVYDFDRVGTDGKKRELHVEKALDVIRTDLGGSAYRPEEKVFSGYTMSELSSCDYFTVEKFSVSTFSTLVCGEESFVSLLFTEGAGELSFSNASYAPISVKKGDSVFLPAGTGEYTVKGSCEFLRSFC